VGRVLHVVLILAHRRLSLLAHVTAEVLPVELAEPREQVVAESPVGRNVSELLYVRLEHRAQRTLTTNRARQRFVLGHSIEVEGLHSLELVGRVAGNASAAACEEKMLRLARSSLKAGCW